MKRILLMVLRLFYRVPGWLMKMHRWAKDDTHSIREKYDLLQDITRRANKAGRVEVQVFGSENIPEAPGFLIIPNHQGFFDMMTLISTCPQPLTGVIKKEARNWPLVKSVCDLLRCMDLDRESPKDALRVITEISDRIKKGENVVIFPEGTRSRQGNIMGEFKPGTFKSALMSKCTILPVALIDCYKPFDTHSIKPVKVQIHYLKPIPYEEYAGMRTKELAPMVQARIQETLDVYAK